MARYGFPKCERLANTGQIRALFGAGKKFSVPAMRLVLRANGLPHNRVLIAPARAYPTAVQRNRARRIGREIYRHVRSRLLPGFDVGFIMYPGDDSYDSRESQVLQLCRRAGILRLTGE